MYHSRIVWGGPWLWQDHTLLDRMRLHHIIQLYCILWWECRCVVLECHYLARLVTYSTISYSHYVYLWGLRSACYLFGVLSSLGGDWLHYIEWIVSGLLVIINSHHHIFLGCCLLKQIKEWDITACMRWRLIMMMILLLLNDRSIILLLWLCFEVIHTLLGLHLGFKFMTTCVRDGGKLVAPARWRVHEGFNAGWRGNSIGRSPATWIQRDMRLFVTFYQH